MAMNITMVFKYLTVHIKMLQAYKNYSNQYLLIYMYVYFT